MSEFSAFASRLHDFGHWELIRSGSDRFVSVCGKLATKLSNSALQVQITFRRVFPELASDHT